MAKADHQGDSGDSSHDDSDMADAEEEGEGTAPVQWNGIQVVHPMDPRIDISKVGYIHRSPVASDQGTNWGDQSKNDANKQDEGPSLENYVQLMEVSQHFCPP